MLGLPALLRGGTRGVGRVLRAAVREVDFTLLRGLLGEVRRELKAVFGAPFCAVRYSSRASGPGVHESK